LILAAVASIAMILLFVLTQDLTARMVLIDWWTIVHAVVGGLQMLALSFIFRGVKVFFETGLRGKQIKQKPRYGHVLEEPEDPTREGYTFGGWYTDKDGYNKWDFEDKVFKGFNLYAHWIDDEEKQGLIREP